MQNRIYVDNIRIEKLATVHPLWVYDVRIPWGAGAPRSSARSLFKFLNTQAENASKISQIRPIEERDELDRKYSQDVIKLSEVDGESLETPLRFWYVGKTDGLHIFTRQPASKVICFPGALREGVRA